MTKGDKIVAGLVLLSVLMLGGTGVMGMLGAGGPFDTVQIGVGSVGQTANRVNFNVEWWMFCSITGIAVVVAWAITGCAFMPSIFPRKWREWIAIELRKP